MERSPDSPQHPERVGEGARAATPRGGDCARAEGMRLARGGGKREIERAADLHCSRTGGKGRRAGPLPMDRGPWRRAGGAHLLGRPST